jgi:glycosyltransferase involved in cell wall biosynthesis
MRLIRLCTNYPAYVEDFYSRRSGLADAPYREQYEALMADGFGWFDVWTHALEPFGYRVWEPVGNAEPMQRQWAREHSVTYDEDAWLTDIAAAQVEHFAPDVVFVNDYATYTAAFFQRLRERCPSIRMIIGWCGAPYPDGSVFDEYDLILSNIPALVEHFRAEGHRSEHMAHAFDPRVLDRIDAERRPRHDFVFAGSIVKAKSYHNRRERLLQELVRATDLEIWSNVDEPSWETRVRYQSRRMLHRVGSASEAVPALRDALGELPHLGPHLTRSKAPPRPYIAPAVASRARAPVFGRSMFQLLSDARVALNTHIDLACDHASNMRLFEATGVGTCLLTERQPDLDRLFKPDEEVVTYASTEEAIERVKYLLDNPGKRRRIAQAGQARTLREYTFKERAKQLDHLIRRKPVQGGICTN